MKGGNEWKLLIVFYVEIMGDEFVMEVEGF